MSPPLLQYSLIENVCHEVPHKNYSKQACSMGKMALQSTHLPKKSPPIWFGGGPMHHFSKTVRQVKRPFRFWPPVYSPPIGKRITLMQTTSTDAQKNNWPHGFRTKQKIEKDCAHLPRVFLWGALWSPCSKFWVLPPVLFGSRVPCVIIMVLPPASTCCLDSQACSSCQAAAFVSAAKRRIIIEFRFKEAFYRSRIGNSLVLLIKFVVIILAKLRCCIFFWT